jgi:hypothetical protein
MSSRSIRAAPMGLQFYIGACLFATYIKSPSVIERDFVARAVVAGAAAHRLNSALEPHRGTLKVALVPLDIAEQSSLTPSALQRPIRRKTSARCGTTRP